LRLRSVLSLGRRPVQIKIFLPVENCVCVCVALSILARPGSGSAGVVGESLNGLPDLFGPARAMRIYMYASSQLQVKSSSSFFRS
jgi:hypothetical protein